MCKNFVNYQSFCIMSRPWTFALVKPDAVANPIAIRWLMDALYYEGLVITKGCRLQIPPRLASDLYSEHQGAFYYGRLIRHICSGPSVVMRLELNNETLNPSEAIQRWRTLLGPSKLFANIYLSNSGEFDQIKRINFRQLFALSDTRNFCHGSDSFKTVQREYSIFEKGMREIQDPGTDLFLLDQFTLSEENYEKEVEEEDEDIEQKSNTIV